MFAIILWDCKFNRFGYLFKFYFGVMISQFVKFVFWAGDSEEDHVDYWFNFLLREVLGEFELDFLEDFEELVFVGSQRDDAHAERYEIAVVRDLRVVDLVDGLVIGISLHLTLRSEFVFEFRQIDVVFDASCVEELALLICHYQFLFIWVWMVHQILEGA